MSDLAAQVRDTAQGLLANARALKADPDPEAPAHAQAAVMESCAELFLGLLGDHAAARAAAEMTATYPQEET